MNKDAEVRVLVKRCPENKITLAMHYGDLKKDDGTVVGAIAGIGGHIEVRLYGMGTWAIDMRDVAASIMEAVGPPDKGPLALENTGKDSPSQQTET